ncbi:MAG: HAMP domain-containing protein [Chloroflexi bacterium]|nr:HAMP domain-containing protein [Chloroflexota bacterium]
MSDQPRPQRSLIRRVLRLGIRYALHPPVPLRWRIALLYMAIVGMTLSVAAVVVYLSLEHYLESEIDDSLRNQVRELSGTIDLDLRREISQPRVNVYIRFPNLDAFTSPGMTVQVLNVDGRVHVQSENLRDRAVPIDRPNVELALAGTPSYTTAIIDRVPVRIYYAPLELSRLDGNIAGVIQVTRTLRDVEVTLARLRLVLIGIGSVSLCFVTVAGYILARAALSPIGRLTRDARSIGESRDFGRRVDVPRTVRASRDEVTRLALTFNQMLHQLQEAYQEQEHTLASQRRFVADASHELRTPLSTIRTNLELLQRAGDDLPPADRDEAMADALAEIERLSRLVGDLLTLARVDSGLRVERNEVIEVDRLIQEVYRQARLMAMSHEHTVIADPVERAAVLGNHDYLKELLLVLADNAIQYTPDGGLIRLMVTREGSEVLIGVQDNGVGIGPDDVPHLFERFYRADHARHRDTGTARGTGLGLSIAQWIAEQHRGRIEVQTELGRGTTFTLRLPAHSAPPADAEAAMREPVGAAALR